MPGGFLCWVYFLFFFFEYYVSPAAIRLDHQKGVACNAQWPNQVWSAALNKMPTFQVIAWGVLSPWEQRFMSEQDAEQGYPKRLAKNV